MLNRVADRTADTRHIPEVAERARHIAASPSAWYRRTMIDRAPVDLACTHDCALTPEEDTIGDPDEADDIDDLLPADLWF